MILRVTDDILSDAKMGVEKMSIGEFNAISSHPRIASANYDAIVIDTDKNVKLGIIPAILTRTLVIPNIVGEVTSHAISILTEMYKDSAAELRYNYMRDKEALATSIANLRSKYQWDKFY